MNTKHADITQNRLDNFIKFCLLNPLPINPRESMIQIILKGLSGKNFPFEFAPKDGFLFKALKLHTRSQELNNEYTEEQYIFLNSI